MQSLNDDIFRYAKRGGAGGAGGAGGGGAGTIRGGDANSATLLSNGISQLGNVSFVTPLATPQGSIGNTITRNHSAGMGSRSDRGASVLEGTLSSVRPEGTWSVRNTGNNTGNTISEYDVIFTPNQ